MTEKTQVLEGQNLDSSFFDRATHYVVNNRHLLAVGGAVTIAGVTYPFLDEPLYYVAGGLAGLTATIFDQMSTTPAIRLMNRPEFKEANLDMYYREKNPLVGSHPTMEEYKKKSKLITLLAIGLSTSCPPFGFVLSLLAPFICRNNRNATKQLEKELECITGVEK